ncbi:MAG TPA: hypothetical protein VII06_11800 [Chloroflexota bacterium]|jgi:hypothetical protein
MNRAPAAASRPGKGATLAVRLPLGDAPWAKRTVSPPRTGRVPTTPPPGAAPEAQRDGR